MIFIAANVETMFSVREKPWHGLGTIVAEAPASAEALRLAGLDREVVQEPVYTGGMMKWRNIKQTRINTEFANNYTTILSNC